MHIMTKYYKIKSKMSSDFCWLLMRGQTNSVFFYGALLKIKQKLNTITDYLIYIISSDKECVVKINRHIKHFKQGWNGI